MQPDPGSQRVVIRPQLGAYVIFGPILLGLFALSVWATADSFRRGYPGFVVLSIPVAAFSIVALIYLVGGTLWADNERVGCSRIFARGSCRRDALASVRIGPPYSRYGPSYAFIRKDGGVAFSTFADVWREGQIKALAHFLQVPLVDTTRTVPRGFVCPVCGFAGLEEATSSNGTGSGEICPSCGFDHSGQVDQQRYGEWRQQWINGGMAWWAAQAGRPAPKDWDPAGQLNVLTG